MAEDRAGPRGSSAAHDRGRAPSSSDASTSPGESPPASAPPVPAEGSPLPDDPTFRYEDLGLIGKGAMGEVRRVRDRDLNRLVAMKIVRTGRMKNRRLLARFIAEAQATAQLTHPGIVPIHELGVLPDGRFFFCMREVRGKTLREVINELHAPGHEESWTLHRVMDVFRKICDAMAYAHSRGVVHRDLKPDNIMVGSFGEVLVLDWGLAKVLGYPATLDREQELDPVVTNRSRDAALATQMGTVAGTPSYMPPEQARGLFSNLGPEADVYSLGAILYEILVGRPPYAASDAQEVIGKILQGPPPSPFSGESDFDSIFPDLRGEGPEIPADLAQLCDRAMQRKAEDRYAHAGELAHECALWLEGVRKRDQALAKVQEARKLYPEVNVSRQRAARLRRRAAQVLATVPAHAAPQDKMPAWRLQEEAVKEEREGAIKETEVIQLLHGAISMEPSLTEAHDLLADYYRDRHERAERLRHTTLAARYEALLRHHDTGKHTAYLRGTGRLTLVTAQPNAEVVHMRYVEQGRRLVPVSKGLLGPAPLHGAPLDHGSHLLVIRCEGFADVRYPVHLGRLDYWHGFPPGSDEPHPVYLPLVEELGERECYVPAGWFLSGGDPEHPGSGRKPTWLDGFAIQRFQVTVEEYLEFLNALVEDGRNEVALAYAPRQQSGPSEDAGPVLFGRDAEGRFHLEASRPETHGWRLDWPITMIDWNAANAYADWYAGVTGQSWRLPAELEWEKAARGVDGRLHPWGDFLDPAFCSMRDSDPRRADRVPVTAYPLDESPYRVRGMAGNVRDFCLDVYRTEGPMIREDGRALILPPNRRQHDAARAERGGDWRSSSRGAHVATRNWADPTRRSANRGFRLVRLLGPPTE